MQVAFAMFGVEGIGPMLINVWQVQAISVTPEGTQLWMTSGDRFVVAMKAEDVIDKLKTAIEAANDKPSKE